MRCIESPSRGRVPEATQRAGLMVGGCVALIAMSGCKPDPVSNSETSVVLCDDNNYAYTPELTVEQQQLRSGEDISITWPDVSEDIFGNPLDDDFAVDEVAIYVFGEHTPDEAVSGVLTESMMQREVDIFGYCAPTDNSCQLSDFMLVGHELFLDTIFTEGSGAWLASLRTETSCFETSFLFLVPSDQSDDDQAAFGDQSTELNLTVDLTSLESVMVPADGNAWLDWSAITVDGLRNALSLYRLDRLQVVHFEDENAVDWSLAWDALTETADQVWQSDVTGVTEWHLHDLASKGQPGPNLDGIDSDGTWLLALVCSTCCDLEPRFLTTLTVQ